MGEYSETYVAFDTSKTKHAVAIADGGQDGEVRFVGEVASSPATVERLIRKLAGRYDKVHFCCEAGPTGLFRQIRELGHDCAVVAPSLIPKKPGERIKTNRRDAVSLARLLRAGDEIVSPRSISTVLPSRQPRRHTSASRTTTTATAIEPKIVAAGVSHSMFREHRPA